jgi:hypothetical protein
VSLAHFFVFAQQDLADLRRFDSNAVDVFWHRKVAFDDHHEAAVRESLVR